MDFVDMLVLASDGVSEDLGELDVRIDRLEKLAARTCEEHPRPAPPKTNLLETLASRKPAVAVAAHTPQPPAHEPTADPIQSESEPTPDAEEIESSLLPAAPSLPEFVFTRTQSSEASPAAQAEFTLNAVQTELTDQLSMLSHQLKLNALHFSDRLAADSSVVKEAEEKLEGNLDKMKKERVRLKDYSGRASGTTWLVLLTVAVVILAWMLMFFIIRLT